MGVNQNKQGYNTKKIVQCLNQTQENKEHLQKIVSRIEILN